jgi:hypothetical protein
LVIFIRRQGSIFPDRMFPAVPTVALNRRIRKPPQAVTREAMAA